MSQMGHKRILKRLNTMSALSSKADIDLRLIGDPTGKKVIDIACGEGFYTRMIRQRGAAKVTGVDLSEKMIGLARASEAQEPLGIDYIVGDGLQQ
jgi:toxoflavin synthase